MSGDLLTYQISGLGVHSELRLPGAISAADVPVDVLVRRRPVPTPVDSLRGDVDVEAGRSSFLFSIDDVGRFLVSAGKTIDFEVLDGVDPAEAALYVLGTGLGAILLQRGCLILHAAAIVRNGHAVALCGRSGAGKSTLAATMCQSGWSFLSDDISRVEPDFSGTPMLWPDGRCHKLSDQSIHALALETRKGEPVRTGIRKHYVNPLTESRTPIALSAIYALRYHEKPSTEFVRLSPLDGAQLLLNQSHRPDLARKLARFTRHVAITGAVLWHTPIFLLYRPRGFSGIDRTGRDLAAHWQSVIALRGAIQQEEI